MPAPLAVDREAVRAHVITHGVREAARAFSLPVGTVGAWSARGDWLANVGKSVTVQAPPASMQPRANGAIVSPSEAALRTKMDVRAKTHHLLSKATLKGAQGMASKDSDSIQAAVDVLLKLTQAADKLHGYSAERTTGDRALVQIAISGTAPVTVEQRDSA